MKNKIEQMKLKELEAELRKCKDIVEMFSNTVMGGIARMSLESMEIINATDGYYRMTGYTREESLLPPFLNCGLNLVVPGDLPQVQEMVGVLLQEGRSVRADYRIRKKDGSIAWNTAFCPGVEGTEGERYIEVFFLDCTQEKSTQIQFASLLNNMTSGLIRARIGDGIRILYANKEFYSQIGFTPEEFSACPVDNDYLRIVHPGDSGYLMERINEFLESDENHCTIDLRILKKGGESCWIRCCGAKLYEERQGENVLQCILTDITKEREQEKLNLLNEERFRIISEHTRDVVFDWDVSTDSIHYSPVFEKMFGYPPPPSISTQEILAGDIFYKEDKAAVKRMISDMRGEKPYMEYRFRMKGRDGTYFWTLHRAATIFDKNCKSIQIVGVISDVNDFMISNLDLQHKATHDPLTGLVNRMAAQTLIEQVLQESSTDAGHIFVHFDIDRFKQINDLMGHAAGDFALQKIAVQMRNWFRSDDILARMGGDEFTVFLINPLSREAGIRKVRQFCQKIYCDFKFEEKMYPLSVSMGVSLYPQDGAGFQELYEHADSALYEAKRSGGNRCEFFSSQDKGNKGASGYL